MALAKLPKQKPTPCASSRSRTGQRDEACDRPAGRRKKNRGQAGAARGG